MESANLSHLHPHDQQQFGGSSSIGLPSFHGVDNHQLWSQNFSEAPSTLTNLHLEDAVTSSREAQHQKDNQITVPPSMNASMFQDVGYQWDNTRPSYNNSSTSQLQRIKEELSGSFPKYGDPSHLGELNLHSSNSNISRHQEQYVQELNERHLLKNFNSVPTSELYGYDAKRNPSCGNMHMPTRRGSSRIHPSAIISSLTPSASSLSCSLGIMNMPPIHHTWGNSIEGNFDEPTPVNPALIRGGLPFGSSYIADLNQDQSTGLSNSQKIPFLNGATQPKRTSEAFTSTKPPSSSPICKKPRFESRCSMSPFKKHIQVRKEKLGDRIAALQQLVSPFGKTDTASVLMEAIGYIKFLQEQVETLSVPYLKSSTNSSSTHVHGEKKGGDQERDNEPKRDLRSRGLCLVPLSCTSYVADDNVWSPPTIRPPIGRASSYQHVHS